MIQTIQEMRSQAKNACAEFASLLSNIEKILPKITINNFGNACKFYTDTAVKSLRISLIELQLFFSRSYCTSNWTINWSNIFAIGHNKSKYVSWLFRIGKYWC